jgi:hypothetical protein
MKPVHVKLLDFDRREIEAYCLPQEPIESPNARVIVCQGNYFTFSERLSLRDGKHRVFVQCHAWELSRSSPLPKARQ